MSLDSGVLPLLHFPNADRGRSNWMVDGVAQGDLIKE